MATMQTVHDLFSAEIKDLYSAEKQLTKAIPKMQKGAHSRELANAFASHLSETETQIDRLEQIGEAHKISVSGRKCKGMEGLISEGAEALQDGGRPVLTDLAITSAASRVEHYEMAGYRSAIALAQQLGYNDAAKLLNETLHEEQAADERMRELTALFLDDAGQRSIQNKKPSKASH